MIENFEKLSFERKIEVLVAQYVMKWDDIRITGPHTDSGDRAVDPYYMCTGIPPEYRRTQEKWRQGNDIIPCYTALLTSAWDIVRKFDYLYLFKSKNFKGGIYECQLKYEREGQIIERDINEKYYAWAETAQLAICYAGLKAVGYPIEDFLKEEGKEIIIGS